MLKCWSWILHNNISEGDCVSPLPRPLSSHVEECSSTPMMPVSSRIYYGAVLNYVGTIGVIFLPTEGIEDK